MGVAYFVARSGQPYNIVTNEGFKVMMGIARPGYVPMGRKALTENYIPRLYEATRAKIAEALKEASYVALAADLWTSDAGDSYMGLTAHFIGTPWALKYRGLNCRLYEESHSGVAMKDWFLEILEEWGIPKDKVTSVTIDNSDNIRLAVNLLNVTSASCFGHTLQTGMDDVKKMDPVIDMCHKTHALRNYMEGPKVKREYKKFILSRHNVEPPSLPGLCPTRWWSELPLNRAIIKYEGYLREFLAVYDSGKHLGLLLNKKQMSFLREYTRTLDLLDELTQGMSAAKYVTASAILPIVNLLSAMLDKAKQDAAAEPDGAPEIDFGGDDDDEGNLDDVDNDKELTTKVNLIPWL
ncbi:hypothetical protein ONE63_000001 [Megalurothrips usitatus]|uniref:Zinc finger BED domain-containing protein 1-like n=1 Tax=Megalurothrips usitatus TaxID=439358 RepID=A0AAV7Y0K4_9NEOP|nr:hypothetical protein ONE63_000001 [Megalurothrips usitatus]